MCTNLRLITCSRESYSTYMYCCNGSHISKGFLYGVPHHSPPPPPHLILAPFSGPELVPNWDLSQYLKKRKKQTKQNKQTNKQKKTKQFYINFDIWASLKPSESLVSYFHTSNTKNWFIFVARGSFGLYEIFSPSLPSSDIILPGQTETVFFSDSIKYRALKKIFLSGNINSDVKIFCEIWCLVWYRGSFLWKLFLSQQQEKFRRSCIFWESSKHSVLAPFFNKKTKQNKTDNRPCPVLFLTSSKESSGSCWMAIQYKLCSRWSPAFLFAQSPYFSDGTNCKFSNLLSVEEDKRNRICDKIIEGFLYMRVLYVLNQMYWLGRFLP